MNNKLKKTFSQIEMDPARHAAIRDDLLALRRTKEENIMHPRSKRLALICALAALFILLCGFTYAVSHIPFFTGPEVRAGRNYIATACDPNYVTPPAKIVDGRIIFTLDGSNRDITSFCSETDYYRYDAVDALGIPHYIIVGGTPDNWGYMEYVLMKNCLAGTGQTGSAATLVPAPSSDSVEPVHIVEWENRAWADLCAEFELWNPRS